MRIDVTIQANKTAKHPVEGRYLHVVSAGGDFSIAAKGIGEIQVGAGGNAEIPPGVQQLEFRDKSGQANNIKLENTDVPFQRAGEQVEVVNKITVTEIEKPIQVEVTSEAVFAEGSEFGLVNAGSLSESLDVPIPSGSREKIVDANANRKELMLTVSGGNQLNTVRVGGPGVDAGRGYALYAGAGAIALFEISSTGAVHMYNEGQEQVTVSVLELLK